MVMVMGIVGSGKCVDEVWFFIGVLVGFMFCSLLSAIKCGHLCAILITPLNYLLFLLLLLFFFFFLCVLN